MTTFQARSDRFAEVVLTTGTSIFVLDKLGDVWEYQTEHWAEWLKFDCDVTDVTLMVPYLELHRPIPWQIPFEDFRDDLNCGFLILGEPAKGIPSQLLYVEPVHPLDHCAAMTLSFREARQ